MHNPLEDHAEAFLEVDGNCAEFEYSTSGQGNYVFRLVNTAGTEMVCELTFSLSYGLGDVIFSRLFVKADFTRVIFECARASKGTPAEKLLWRIFQMVGDPLPPVEIIEPMDYRWLPVPHDMPTKGVYGARKPVSIAKALDPDANATRASSASLYACEFFRAYGIAFPHLSLDDLWNWCDNNWQGLITPEIQDVVQFSHNGHLGLILAKRDHVVKAAVVSIGDGRYSSSGAVRGTIYGGTSWMDHFQQFQLVVPRNI